MAFHSKRFIRGVTALIPIRGLRKRLRRRWLDAAQAAWTARMVPIVRARYDQHIAQCRAKLTRGEKLRVSFLVCDASMFSGESVFLEMRNDPRFVCSICVAPRVSRGDEFLRETLTKTVAGLTAKYGDAVRALYNPDTGKALQLDADIVFSTVIYEDQTLPNFTTERLSEHALVALLYYGYGGLFCTNEKKTPFLPNIVLAWRYYVSNEATRQMNLTRNPLLAHCLRVAGYVKMDRLENEMAQRVTTSSRRKKIILSPHHTIDKAVDGLALSTFLQHADLYLRLPELFPEVDFVFRPHPLLFVRLATSKWWGEARTRAYKEKMAAFPNVEFQQGGDYFATFADSDALIHDCGSFLAEYFYTGKPQCYLLEGPETVAEQFLPFARQLLDHAYRAYTGEEIVAFIWEVVINGNDSAKEARKDFAAQEVCVNHPHATAAVITDVLQELINE